MGLRKDIYKPWTLNIFIVSLVHYCNYYGIRLFRYFKHDGMRLLHLQYKFAYTHRPVQVQAPNLTDNTTPNQDQ